MENVKASHASTKIEFMWGGHTSAHRTYLHHCNETSVLNFHHYNLAGCFQSHLQSEQRVRCFSPPCNKVSSRRSGYHFH